MLALVLVECGREAQEVLDDLATAIQERHRVVQRRAPETHHCRGCAPTLRALWLEFAARILRGWG